MKSVSPWVSLIRLLNEIEQRWGYTALDQNSKRVLEWVHFVTQSHGPVYVLTVILESGIASPATLHKSMANLRREGLLVFSVDPSDSRRKIVSLSQKADSLLKHMSKDLPKGLQDLKPS